MATIPNDLLTVDNIVLAAEACKESPKAVRSALLGQTTMEIDFGTYGKTAYRLIGVCQDRLADGTGYAALSFFPLNGIGGIVSTDWDNPNGYSPNGALGKKLTNLWSYMVDQYSSYDATSLMADLIVPVKKEYNKSLHDVDIVVFNNLWLPSCNEIGWKFVMIDSGASLTDMCPPSGTTFDWFKDVIDITSDKRILNGLTGGMYFTRDTSFRFGGGRTNPVVIYSEDEYNGMKALPVANNLADIAPCFSVGKVEFPPAQYVAGDTENAPEWIDPNTDNYFLDETNNWSVITV